MPAQSQHRLQTFPPDLKAQSTMVVLLTLANCSHHSSHMRLRIRPVQPLSPPPITEVDEATP